MLDVALLMANASQLKAVIEQGPDFSFYIPLIALISISLTLQIAVGVLLIFIGEPGSRRTSTDTQCCVHSPPLISFPFTQLVRLTKSFRTMLSVWLKLRLTCKVHVSPWRYRMLACATW
ncbi:NINJ1 protein, partial [Amia calva]|nr:NINJ1 protein [Amia calva]